MRSSRPIISRIAGLVMLAWAGSAHAQFGIGLYKDGRLIDTLGAAGFSGGTAPIVAAGKSGAAAAVAPAVSAETQTRNQLFADSTMLGIRIQQALREMQNDSLANNKEKQTAELQLLSDLLQQLTAKQTDVRAAFDAIGARLLELKLPPEILERHARAVASNEVAFATFASTVNDVINRRPGAVPTAVALMDQTKLRDEPDLARRGPTRQSMQIVSAPELTQEQASAAVGTSKAAGAGKASISPPNGGDLAETPDVQLTSAIRAKAANLGNSPQAIYEFVRNKVKFQPYLGSRKGADFTLQQMAGNDTDQASLLVALLRAANIPCRYVRGTMEMTPTQAASWLGVDDLSTAANILATAGLNGSFFGGNVRCTHVWVEAYLPFSNYRGVPNDDSGRTWVPLDPAFKLTTIAQGEDVLAAMGYTNDAFLASYISTYNSNSPIQALQLSVRNWLNTNRPGTNFADIERTVATQPLNLGLLPASLPINAITASDGFPSLHDTNRFKIRFNLHNGGTTFINFTTNLCQLVGHKVTISYIGATAGDQATIDAHGGVYQTPPYLVNVKPVLKVDGNPVATAASSIGMGYRHDSDMYFTQPVGDQNVQPAIFNDITAGNSQVIGFDTFTDVPAFSLGDTNSAPDALLMNLLHSTALDYLSRVDRGEEDANRLLRTVHTVDVSEDILESSVSVLYSFGGVPQTFTWTGMIVDADRRIIGPFAVNGDNSKVLPFMKLTGHDASFMESDVFEDSYAQRAVSTIRILQLSRDQGIPTCYITNSISSGCPGFSHSSSIISAVNNALAQGHIVIIPRSPITIGQWFGTGYIDLNPITGAAGYIISGGQSGSVSANGGATVDTWPVFLPCWFPTVSNDPSEPIKSYRNGFFGDTEADAFMACDEHRITLKGYFRVQCPNRPVERQYFKGTTHYSIQEIADAYG
ncbi:MAG TPA: transglutaminase-like domain-containing protein, partial [Verrucomicrobiae bacterium]